MNVCTETSHRMNILEFTHISKALSDFFAAPISLTVVIFFQVSKRIYTCAGVITRICWRKID